MSATFNNHKSRTAFYNKLNLFHKAKMNTFVEQFKKKNRNDLIYNANKK